MEHDEHFTYAEKAAVRIGGKMVNLRKREDMMNDQELAKHEKKVSREKKKSLASKLTKQTSNTVNQMDANGNKMSTAV